MTDPRIAVFIEAERKATVTPWPKWRVPEDRWAAILAALDSAGWRLHARDKMCPHEAEIARLRSERNHYLAGCRCTMRGYCTPHGWAGTVEPDDYEICADHEHAEPDPVQEAEVAYEYGRAALEAER